MSKAKKLLDRIRNSPINIRFEDLDLVLRKHGFKCRQPGGGSSHFTYTTDGCPLILTVPKHRPVNEVYVKRVLKAIEEYGHLSVDSDEE